MLLQLQSWFKDKLNNFQEDDPRLSVAILLFSVMMSDGKIDPREERELHGYLQDHFELSDHDTKRLIVFAQSHSSSGEVALALQQMKRDFDTTQRLALLQEMWHMVFIDDEDLELENNYVERAGEMLGLSSEEILAIYLEEVILPQHK